MSALYLGTGDKETFLMQRLQRKLESNKSISLSILLDFMRGTRVNWDNMSSETMLRQFKSKNLSNQNLWFSFYYNPRISSVQELVLGSGWEIIGVHHMKLHVFDDNVLITGANLSEDYFTDR